MSLSPLVLRGPSLAPPTKRQSNCFLMDAFVDYFMDDQHTLAGLMTAGSSFMP